MIEKFDVVYNWLYYTLRSDEKHKVINLETQYEAAVHTLISKTSIISEDLVIEGLFKEIHFWIKEAREFLLNNNNLININERVRLLDSFEIILRKHLDFETSAFRPILKWSDTKQSLAEVFSDLKNRGKLSNSNEDLANFLKNNFDVYKETELSTIITTLKKSSAKSAKKKNQN